MNQEDRIRYLQSFVASPGWTEIVLPAYQAKLVAEMEALAASSLNEDFRAGVIETVLWAIGLPTPRERERNRRRGRIAALKELLKWPQYELEQDVLDKEREQVYSSVANERQLRHYAEFGYKSPYAPPMDNPS
jgi:hypothetical protein